MNTSVQKIVGLLCLFFTTSLLYAQFNEVYMDAIDLQAKKGKEQKIEQEHVNSEVYSESNDGYYSDYYSSDGVSYSSNARRYYQPVPGASYYNSFYSTPYSSWGNSYYGNSFGYSTPYYGNMYGGGCGSGFGAYPNYGWGMSSFNMNFGPSWGMYPSYAYPTYNNPYWGAYPSYGFVSNTPWWIYDYSGQYGYVAPNSNVNYYGPNIGSSNQGTMVKHPSANTPGGKPYKENGRSTIQYNEYTGKPIHSNESTKPSQQQHTVRPVKSPNTNVGRQSKPIYNSGNSNTINRKPPSNINNRGNSYTKPSSVGSMSNSRPSRTPSVRPSTGYSKSGK